MSDESEFFVQEPVAPLLSTPDRINTTSSVSSMMSSSTGRKKSKKKGSHSENVKVVCRVRPSNKQEAENNGFEVVTVHPDGKNISISMDSAPDTFTNASQTAKYSFEFDKVFDRYATQEDVYEDVGKGLIDDVLDGFNAAIIAYGQTGSGKTYTMQGKAMDKSKQAHVEIGPSMGIIPRIVMDIFSRVENSDPNEEYLVVSSFVEVYKEKLRDLMCPTKDNLTILEDKSKGLTITDATDIPVKNLKEVMSVMSTGLKNRFVAETNCNTDSSRSHAIFLLTIYKRDHILQETKHSQLYLVDLAGSEKVAKTLSTGQRLDEAKAINTSLLALRQVIYALTDKKKSHIPYRDSKLTRLLQNSFGGNSHSVLIINVSPNSFNASETLSTLRFGDQTRHIKNKPTANKQRTVEELTRLLDEALEENEQHKSTIRQLQAELSRFRSENSGPRNDGTSISFRELKKFFICPISNTLMVDPIYAMDGHTYDKKSMQQYIRNNKTLISPVTKQPMIESQPRPNHLVRTQLDYFISVYGPHIFHFEENTPEPLLWTLEESVPVEVLHHMFSFLPASSLLSCGKVAREWCQLSLSNHLWLRLILQDFGTEKYSSVFKNTPLPQVPTDVQEGKLSSAYWELFKMYRSGVTALQAEEHKGIYLFATH